MEDLRSGGNVNSGDEYFLQKKFEFMIDSNNKKITNELNSIKSMINKLNEDICEIRRGINGNNGLMPKKETIIISEESTQNDLKTKNSMPQRPRYGEYQPEDVSVNKFFYFGNKK